MQSTLLISEKKKIRILFDIFATWILNLELNVLYEEWKINSWFSSPVAPPFVLLHSIASMFQFMGKKEKRMSVSFINFVMMTKH